MDENKGIFVKDRAFYRSFFSMTAVIALQSLVIYSVNLADNIMIGNYSENALSGIALVNQVQFLLQMVVMGLGNGLGVLAAQYWGKGRIQPVKRIIAIVFGIGIPVALIFTAAGALIPRQILFLLTDNSAIIDEGAAYFRIVCISYIFFTVTNILLAAFRSVESPQIGFYVSLCALFINIALNYCLIFGKFGFPELGARGAAAATVAARAIEAVITVIYTLRLDKKVKISIGELFTYEKDYFRDYVRHGFPLCLSSTSWGLAMFLQAAIIGRLGPTAIASSAIATTIYQVISVFTYSTGNATSVIIGKAVGAGRLGCLRQYSRTLQIMFLITGTVSALMLYAFRMPIIGVYDVAPETAELAEQFIKILCVTLVGTAYEMPCLGGIVSGGGDTKFVFYNDLIFMWGIVLPLSALSAYKFGWGAAVTFFLLKSDQITKCAVAVFKVNRYRWIKNVTRDNAEAPAASADEGAQNKA